jgi:hypothetical protein
MKKAFKTQQSVKDAMVLGKTSGHGSQVMSRRQTGSGQQLSETLAEKLMMTPTYAQNMRNESKESQQSHNRPNELRQSNDSVKLRVDSPAFKMKMAQLVERPPSNKNIKTDEALSPISPHVKKGEENISTAAE